MPEGCECRVLTDQLMELVYLKRLEDIRILSGRYSKSPLVGLDDFLEKAKDTTVINVDCKGKFIYWQFPNEWALFSTLGMTGGYCKTANDYARIQFDFGSFSLFYCDIRSFGTMKFVQGNQFLQEKLDEIGPDMLSNPPSLDQFYLICDKHKKKSVVKFLLEQKAISGVGNIYKSESLWLAGIDPHRLVSSLSIPEQRKLYNAIRLVLENAYSKNGSSIQDFADLEGVDGTYASKQATAEQIEKGQFSIMVYNQKIDPYGNKIEKIYLDDDRSTYFVRERQK